MGLCFPSLNPSDNRRPFLLFAPKKANISDWSNINKTWDLSLLAFLCSFWLVCVCSMGFFALNNVAWEALYCYTKQAEELHQLLRWIKAGNLSLFPVFVLLQRPGQGCTLGSPRQVEWAPEQSAGHRRAGLLSRQSLPPSESFGSRKLCERDEREDAYWTPAGRVTLDRFPMHIEST